MHKEQDIGPKQVYTVVVTQQYSAKERCLVGNSIYYSESICKQISNLGLEKYFRRIVLKHIMAILIAVFSYGYRGKMTQMSTASEKHRTTIAHFLNHGRWKDTVLEQILKAQVVRAIYGEAERTGKPVICIVDDHCIKDKAFVTGDASN